MNIYDFLFILQMVIVVGIFFTKTYNIISSGTFYDIRTAFMLFIGQWLAWLVGFMAVLMNAEKLIFIQLFKLEVWLSGLATLFFVIEFFFLISAGASGPIKAHIPEAGGKNARI